MSFLLFLVLSAIAAHSLIALFYQLVVNDWWILMEAVVYRAGEAARVFFISFYAISVLIVFSVCTGKEERQAGDKAVRSCSPLCLLCSHCAARSLLLLRFSLSQPSW